MLAQTSKPRQLPALLVLEDGAVFAGFACGAVGEVFGEICFNTSMEGYLEVITDPSYAGQIVTMTYPQIGNYGVNPDDAQSDHPALRGLVVRDMCATPSNWRSEMSLPAFLEREGVVAIEGVDTRALVRHVRDNGAMRAVLSSEDVDADSLLAKVRASQPIVGVNLAETVSRKKASTFGRADVPESKSFAVESISSEEIDYHVVAYDCGVKRSILEGLVRAGCEVEVVPWDTPAEDVLAKAPDGVFLSNGPGDPDAVGGTYRQVEKLLGNVPLFGICLGHQMICKAAGARIEKLKFGHRGGNHPVMNLRTGRVEITAQNHGFNLVFPSLGPLVETSYRHSNVPMGHSEPPACQSERGEESPISRRGRSLAYARDDKGLEGFDSHADDLRFWAERGIAPVVANERFGRIQLTHVNLNDGTAEGIAFLDLPAFSVQYHPEANPGPTDSHYLFTAFTRLMDGREDYLDIDIAKDRLQGWKF